MVGGGGGPSPELVNRTTGGGQPGVWCTLLQQKGKGSQGTVHLPCIHCRAAAVFCRMKARYVFSMCGDVQAEGGGVGKEMQISHMEMGRMCFPEHTTDC